MAIPRLKITRWISRFVIALLICGVVGYLVLGGIHRSIKICGICGAKQFSTEWYSLYSSKGIEYTPLSDFITKEGIYSNHKHQWLLVYGFQTWQGGGNGTGHQLRGISKDPDFLRFIEAVVKYQGLDQARQWLETGLDPKRSILVQSCFRMNEDEVRDQASFDRWFSERYEDWKEVQSE